MKAKSTQKGEGFDLRVNVTIITTGGQVRNYVSYGGYSGNCEIRRKVQFRHIDRTIQLTVLTLEHAMTCCSSLLHFTYSW